MSETSTSPLEDRHPFDVFFEANGYEYGQGPQAFADWLSSLTGVKVVGISAEGAVEGHP